MIGPVGFAETSSTWMRSGVSAEPAPKRLPCVDDRRERTSEPGVVHRDVQESGARDLDRRDPVERRRTLRELRGHLARRPRCAPARRSATFVA